MTTASTLTVPTRPRVLFVGHDDGSPQIAASLLRRVAGDRLAVQTAGTQPADPGGRSDEMLVAMGLDHAEERRPSAAALRAADCVVVLGADLDVARLPGPRYEEWDLANDDLVARVQGLSDDLARVPAAAPRWAVLDRLRSLIGVHRRR